MFARDTIVFRADGCMGSDRGSVRNWSDPSTKIKECSPKGVRENDEGKSKVAEKFTRSVKGRSIYYM